MSSNFPKAISAILVILCSIPAHTMASDAQVTLRACQAKIESHIEQHQEHERQMLDSASKMENYVHSTDQEIREIQAELQRLYGSGTISRSSPVIIQSIRQHRDRVEYAGRERQDFEANKTIYSNAKIKDQNRIEELRKIRTLIGEAVGFNPTQGSHPNLEAFNRSLVAGTHSNGLGNTAIRIRDYFSKPNCELPSYEDLKAHVANSILADRIQAQGRSRKVSSSTQSKLTGVAPTQQSSQRASSGSGSAR